MNKKIKFTKGDLEKNYTSPCGCSIYTAMKRARVPVLSVTPEFWRMAVDRCIAFGPELQEASDILADACNSRDEKALALRDSLLGKSFVISY